VVIDRRLRAIHGSIIAMLETLDGQASVNMMIQSDRIVNDFEEEIRLRASTDPGHVFNLAVREFVNFPPGFELRAFIHQGVFTCLTQYNNFVCDPTLVRRAGEVEKACRRFIDSRIIPGLGAQPAPGLTSFVLDLALDPQPDGSFNIYVVELNPFAEFTGGALFKWSLDKPVMFGFDPDGAPVPFEFRFNTEPPPFRGVNDDQQKFMADVLEGTKYDTLATESEFTEQPST